MAVELAQEVAAQVAVERATVMLCAWRSLTIETAECLLMLRDRGWAYVVGRGDALIQRVRSNVVSKWYRTQPDSDVFLMVDDDVVFLPEDAERVVNLAREKRAIAIGAYPVKDGTHLACRVEPGISITFGPDIVPRVTDLDPVEIIYPATGFMAVHRDVIKAMVESDRFPLCGNPDNVNESMWPLFDTFWQQKPDGLYEYLSEDYAFGEVARQLGFKTWLDTAVILYHMGVYPYNVHNMRNVTHTEYVDERPIQTSRGFTMHFPADDTFISSQVRQSGQWEEPVARVIEDYLRPDWTFLDLGASVGYFSLIAARQCAKVIAVEADPDTVTLLCENAKANGLDDKIEAHPLAVATYRGVANLSLDPENNGNPGAAYLGEKGKKVQAVKLDDILAGRRPEFIKLDIEGLEHAILADNPEVTRNAQVIVFEVSPNQSARYGSKISDLLTMLKQAYGFRVTMLDGSPVDARVWNMKGWEYTNLLARRA